jgi:hypothetical protein
MRSRPLLGACAALISLSHIGRTQSSDRLAAGLQAGDYVRISGGVSTPVNPQGSLRDWSTGTGLNVGWENWQNGGTGVGRLGVSVNLSYTLLPLDDSQFVSDFIPITGPRATSAHASDAGILEIATNLRFRIPSPLVMPTINFGLGFMNWMPATIDYSTAAGTTGSAKQRHRSGAELTIGGGVERHLVDRYGLFAEAVYAYGFTSIGQGSAAPGGLCGTQACDVLKNTSIATLRGGLSVRVR